MQSAPTEWALAFAFVGLVDFIRDIGEPDGDTLSECIRTCFRVDTPRGRLVFTATLAASAVGFRRHICKDVTW